MDKTALIAIAILSISFLFFSGCITNVSQHDMLNSKILLNVSEFIDKIPKPLDRPDPCTCMVCTRDSPPTLSYWWYKINPFKSKLIENDLVSSQCGFLPCNASIYSKTLADFNPDKGVWGSCTVPWKPGQDLVCAPRYFMIGQGINSAEFSLAQRYCGGRLNMPVIWALQKTDSTPPIRPSPSVLMCYLAKSQMPIVVWKSNNKFMDDTSYIDMLKAYSNLTADPKIEGPLMITTEANLDPYAPSLTGQKTLNIELLNKVKNQIDMIKTYCPKCLSVLALKPTFNETSIDMPDMCPLDYFVKFQSQDLNAPDDPFNCASRYPAGYSHAARPAAISGFSDKIDIIGVAFVANTYPNTTNCKPMSDIARHQFYSRLTLQNYQKPSVWYSVGIGATITNTPGCSFSEESAAEGYDFLLTSIAGDVSSGIIGVAPYKFLDAPANTPKNQPTQTPLDCAQSNQKLYSTDLTSLSEIYKGAVIPISGSSKQITVTDIIANTGDTINFDSAEGPLYAWIENGYVSINQSIISCKMFGFRQADGTPRGNMLYSWFSNCQYYFTNRGYVFTADISSPNSVSAGTTLTSTDGKMHVTVQSINNNAPANPNEVIFYGTDGIKYSARQDGSNVIISDMPFVEQATQQPLMFSTNGQGGYCELFQAGGAKMIYRTPLTKSRPPGSDAPSPPLDPALQKNISQMQCGACLSSVPMPFAFCQAKDDVPSRYGLTMPPKACYQYPEMDPAFLMRDLDPVMMRALAAGESSLGNGIDVGEKAPACAISAGDPARCGGADVKTPANLETYETNYCKGVVRAKAQAILDSGQGICALGVFQCIKSPSADYNPFNPYDSATCGASQFRDGTRRYDYMLNQLQIFRQAYAGTDATDPLKGGIGPDELEWYAAWFAAYHYSGMEVASLDRLQNYKQLDSNDNVVKFMHRELETYCDDLKKKNPKAACYPYYGTAFILRYNDAIDKCGNGCPYQDCVQH